MATVYRDSCGSLRGLIGHQSAGESPCGWCAQAETAARLAAEAVTWPASPVAALLAPVTADQATANRATLAAEVEAFERDQRADPRYRAPVSPEDATRHRDGLAAELARPERRAA